jgi:group II intron reverse transcriptase/maturase
MKELYREGLANHPDPESCADNCKVVGEALTGESAGQTLSCEIQNSSVPTLLTEAEGNTSDGARSKSSEDLAQSETLSMHGHSLHGNREILEAPSAKTEGRLEKATNHTSNVHVSRKSDNCVVPGKESNKDGEIPSAEVVEGRQLTKGNALDSAAVRTQSRIPVSTELQCVRKVARSDKRVRFTNLLRFMTFDLLRESFFHLKREAASGIDGLTWAEYEVDHERRLNDLHDRIHTGTYRAKPSRRIYIPKADGKQRPLGIASVEDKIAQQAIVAILNAIYEEDFVGYSYGFRPGKSQHMALDALTVGIKSKKVNWVLDADIQGFFDNIDHEWMMKFLEHRIADRRLLRLIRKWLRVGVSEEGQWSKTTVGTPQGAVISPLLANVYLHYVLDLWVHKWRKTTATGDMIMIRYADDFVMGFQHRHKAEQFMQDLRIRLQKFGLTLHSDKTRLIEFGRFAAENRKRKGKPKPETFDFLGFTHICGKTTKTGWFTVIRKTIKKRMRTKLQEIGAELMRRRHEPVHVLGKWLRLVVQGHFNYYAVPGNIFPLGEFRTQVNRLWLKALKRRSQRFKLNWERFNKTVMQWIPRARILHPYPEERFYAKYPR